MYLHTVRCCKIGVSRKALALILRPRTIFGPHDNTLLQRLLSVARSALLPLIGVARLDGPELSGQHSGLRGAAFGRSQP